MRIHELQPPAGSTRTSIRIGRGHGSGKVKTGGKGTKGQNARAGGGVPPYFEGGQLPLIRKLPYRRVSGTPSASSSAWSTCAIWPNFLMAAPLAPKNSKLPAWCAAKLAP